MSIYVCGKDISKHEISPKDLAAYGFDSNRQLDYSKFKKIGEGGFGNVYQPLDDEFMVYKQVKASPKDVKEEIIENEIYANGIMKHFATVDDHSKQKIEDPLIFYGFVKATIEKNTNEEAQIYTLIFARNRSDLRNARINKLMPKYSLSERFAFYFRLATKVFVMHKAGIQHCDLKPENIMLEWENDHDDEIPRKFIIIDYGKVEFEDHCSFGTMYYSDPMTIASRRERKSLGVDIAAGDVYSLAAIFVEYEAAAFLNGRVSRDMSTNLKILVHFYSNLKDQKEKEVALNFLDFVIAMVGLNGETMPTRTVLLSLGSFAIQLTNSIETLCGIKYDTVADYIDKIEESISDVKENLKEEKLWEHIRI